MGIRQGALEGVVMDNTFWKGKKVLLTGHTGFKGSWMALWLQSLGANVIGYSLPPLTKPNLFEIASIAERMTSEIGDIRDLEHFKRVIATYRPEVIIHMAAQSLVRYSYLNPVETYTTNVIGTVNVLEAIRLQANVRAVVIVTSDKCYRNEEWHWGYRENEPMGGHDPYSSSKGCAELVASAYRDSYFSEKNFSVHGVAVATARAGNVIGGGDWSEDRLIPDIMRAVIARKAVVIRNPNAIRPWQHVLEPLEGYLLLAEKLYKEGPKYAEGWNFGPDEDSKAVSWIVDQLVQLWGENASWELDQGTHPHEANYLKLDCSKAKMKLEWVPRINLKLALNWVAEWYKAYNQNEDMRKFTEIQIARFNSVRSL